MTETVEIETAHTPLPIVHCNTFVPTPTALNEVFGALILPMVAIPDTTLQVPVPTAGLFAFKVAFVAHTLWVTPALDAVGG